MTIPTIETIGFTPTHTRKPRTIVKTCGVKYSEEDIVINAREIQRRIDTILGISGDGFGAAVLPPYILSAAKNPKSRDHRMALEWIKQFCLYPEPFLGEEKTLKQILQAIRLLRYQYQELGPSRIENTEELFQTLTAIILKKQDENSYPNRRTENGKSEVA